MISVRDARFLAASRQLRETGLLGWVSFVLCDTPCASTAFKCAGRGSAGDASAFRGALTQRASATTSCDRSTTGCGPRSRRRCSPPSTCNAAGHAMSERDPERLSTSEQTAAIAQLLAYGALRFLLAAQKALALDPDREPSCGVVNDGESGQDCDGQHEPSLPPAIRQQEDAA